MDYVFLRWYKSSNSIIKVGIGHDYLVFVKKSGTLIRSCFSETFLTYAMATKKATLRTGQKVRTGDCRKL